MAVKPPVRGAPPPKTIAAGLVRGAPAQPKTKLYEHMAYPDTPFGPYEKAEAVSRNNTQTFLPGGGTARIDRLADGGIFSLAGRIDTSEFAWGQLVITAEPTGMPNSDEVNLPQNAPHVEVQVMAYTGMVSCVWFEGALNDSGPIFLPFAVGEVPDVLEIYAQMLAGSWNFPLPRSAGFTVNVATRFHR